MPALTSIANLSMAPPLYVPTTPAYAAAAGAAGAPEYVPMLPALRAIWPGAAVDYAATARMLAMTHQPGYPGGYVSTLPGVAASMQGQPPPLTQQQQQQQLQQPPLGHQSQLPSPAEIAADAPPNVYYEGACVGMSLLGLFC